MDKEKTSTPDAKKEQAKVPFEVVKNVPKLTFPRLSIFMGLPKIGKSTSMAKLPKALVVDLEGRGYDGIAVDNLTKATSWADLKVIIDYFLEEKNYKILVIDHLRILTGFFADQVARENGKRFVEEIEYGKGTAQLRMTIDKMLKFLNKKLGEHPDKYIMIVAHAMDRNGEIRLDVDGKNETLVLGLVDAVGYINRDEDNQTTVTFKARGGVEFGCRNPKLADYEGVLDWPKLFKLAKGEK